MYQNLNAVHQGKSGATPVEWYAKRVSVTRKQRMWFTTTESQDNFTKLGGYTNVMLEIVFCTPRYYIQATTWTTHLWQDNLKTY